MADRNKNLCKYLRVTKSFLYKKMDENRNTKKLHVGKWTNTVQQWDNERLFETKGALQVQK